MMRFEEGEDGTLFIEEGTSVSRASERLHNAKLVLGVNISSILFRRSKNRCIVLSMTSTQINSDASLEDKEETTRFVFQPKAFGALAEVLRKFEKREQDIAKFRQK